MRLQTSLRIKGWIQIIAMSLAFIVTPLSFAESGTDISEPEVIIKQSDDKKISEYYVNGVLVEIKVEPKNAPTYYLIPSDNGQMIRADESQLLLPTWKLLEW
ncbi:DUF2782 domain-containing protein [Litoribrevibacter albus]|uniref:DUF2782 domain-containing protein n=1 Tax=Litoribrevibacter albus TaxID=1473156 RepID=A0AA37W983_9GAMM|nr:DUF2782 domain-containing protein [Litoribrevibacter albus]GLQ32969.1 hypothetical protein GCM10007876_34480 [Litoribrevibacter albus]